MARDRQRGKRRRSADGGVAARPAVPRDPEESPVQPPVGGDDGLDAAQDAGVEDVLDERGPEGTTPAPDPLKHASPYVDEAKLSEAGATVGAPGDGDERPDDALEYSSRPADDLRRDDDGQSDVAASRSGRALSFLRQSSEELKRVKWPNRRQTGQGTAVTLGFVVLAGGFLGLMDAIWKPIVEAII